MTLEDLCKKMEGVNHPFTPSQLEVLSHKFGDNANYHAPMLSKVLYIEASVGEDNAFILHGNGCIDRIFNVEEKSTLGIMFLGDDVFVSYY